MKTIHPCPSIIFLESLKKPWKAPINLWVKACHYANTIMDVGAHFGIYSLPAAAVNPKATVYGFEPHSIAFVHFKKIAA